MPELPDLQAFSRNLTKRLKGKTLESVDVVVDKKLNASAEELNHALGHHELEKIERVGKELHAHFKGGNILSLHLMLHGNLSLYQEGDAEPKFQIITLKFTDGTRLSLTDFQKAATPILNPEKVNVPDAMDIDADTLKARFAKTKTPVKTVLMDQKVLRGIGNAYADEILWHARISPFSPANKLPEKKVEALVKAIKEVLTDAEKQILKAQPDIISGEVRDFLVVHQPRKKETAGGIPILQKEVGGRKTYYTDEQELFE